MMKIRSSIGVDLIRLLGILSIFTSGLAMAKLNKVLPENAYPFAVSEERKQFLINNYKRVDIGASYRDVLSLLGEPDEVLDLYEPIIKNSKIIGYTTWYVIKRKICNGSVNSKNEAVIRFTFDLKDKVTKVDQWGFF